MRRVIIETSNRWHGLLPRELTNISYTGTREPAVRERVRVEMNGIVIGKNVRVERVYPANKTYDIRIW